MVNDKLLEFERHLINQEKPIMFQMGNDKGKITDTDYFDSKFGKSQLFYLSFNAGVGRLLVPDQHCAEFFNEVRTAKYAILSMGRIFDGVEWRKMGELVFEDFTDSPFSIHIQSELIDRAITPEPQKTSLATYSREGMQGEEFVLYIRTVDTLPCLKPWDESL